MKNVLLLIHADDGQEARLQSALDLTRALDGHLTCLAMAELPVALAGDYLSYQVQATVLEIQHEREANNRTAIERRLAHEGVAWSWIEAAETLGDGILDHAALADLIVLNSKLASANGPNMVHIAGQVLMHTRKPVVAVPESVRRFDTGRALIAWDGHPSCLQSLQACVPLLALADEVKFYMVRDGSHQLDPQEAAQYLSRHDIRPEVHIDDDPVVPIDMLIREQSEDWKADYIVMGAYGRGRLVELFGGTTKHMLANCAIPLVLTH